MTVKTDPVYEAIARKLLGINSMPPLEQVKMIKRAARAGAKALKAKNSVTEEKYRSLWDCRECGESLGKLVAYEDQWCEKHNPKGKIT